MSGCGCWAVVHVMPAVCLHMVEDHQNKTLESFWISVEFTLLFGAESLFVRAHLINLQM